MDDDKLNDRIIQDFLPLTIHSIQEQLSNIQRDLHYIKTCSILKDSSIYKL